MNQTNNRESKIPCGHKNCPRANNGLTYCVKINNRIREEWEKGLENIIYDSYQIIDSNGRGFENVKWFVDKLLKSQREGYIEKIELLYGDTVTIKKDIAIPHSCIEYETALDDIINLIKEE